MKNITLYSHEYGPFPHIVRIALAEKGLVPGRDLKIKDVDPTSKPADFLELSPTGKTPLLLVQGRAIFETVVVLECLDDLFDDGVSFRAASPVERAVDRSWAQFGLDLLMDSFHAVMAPDQDTHEVHARELRRKLGRLESKLGSNPFLGGEKMGWADLVHAAFFLRQVLFQKAFGWDVLTEFPRVASWSSNLLQRPTVIETLPADFENVVLGFIRSQNGYITRGS